jgi:hypothetical protein
MRKLLQLILIVVCVMALLPLYSRFKAAAAPIPPGVYLAGLNLSDMKDPAEVRRHLEPAYSEPIAVYFGDKRLLLRPQEVDLQIEVEQMIAEAGQYLEGTTFIDIALREAFGFDQQRRDVPLRFMLNGEKLRAWLQQAAAAHDGPPTGARLLPPADRMADGGAAAMPPGFVGLYTRDWSWVAGSPGYRLDIDASIPLLVAALTRLEDREAHLVVVETPAHPPTIADLERELDRYLADFPGFAAVYIQDLVRELEVNVDADVAFSGMSTLKIGIITLVLQTLKDGIVPGDQASRDLGQLIDYALGESNNYAANRLLSYLGGGDTNAGARRFTEFMRSLGFRSTYMQSGYDAQVAFSEIPTPGNQRDDWSANPDRNLQTTPAEIGQMLASIYECTQGRGLLVVHYPEDFTPEKCMTALYYISHDEFAEMLWGGLPVPQQAWIIHKHGFAYESHSDVALIWGPTGPYVISVFLFRRGWMDWGTSNTAMKAVSRITWNYFDFEQKTLGLERPEPFILEPPPGYVRLPTDYQYRLVASRGFVDKE